MQPSEQAVLLRIFLGSQDKLQGNPLYEEIVYAAQESGLSGATVMRGVMGFGASAFMHTTKILAVSEELPIIIEIIDSRQKIEEFMEMIDPYMKNSKFGGLISIEPIQVWHYTGKSN
jgi:PII-like signaling protein